MINIWANEVASPSAGCTKVLACFPGRLNNTKRGPPLSVLTHKVATAVARQHINSVVLPAADSVPGLARLHAEHLEHLV